MSFGFVFLALFAIALAACAMLLERHAPVRISERHHRSHDTFVVNGTFTRSLAIAIVVSGIIGLLLSYLCIVDVFDADPVVIMAFFDAFLVTLFVLWVLMSRYKVSLFDDQLFVTPFMGRDISVFYSDIDRITWSRKSFDVGGRNLKIWIGGEKVATIWGIVDVERILMRIDRFDAFPHGVKLQEG